MPKRTCDDLDVRTGQRCGRPAIARRRCTKHYQAFMAANPDVPRIRERVTLERSVLGSLQPQPNGCLRWMGKPDKKGYGNVGRRSHKVHRWIWERYVGPIPTGMVLDHVCHNSDPGCPGGPSCLHRTCCLISHLEVTTPEENTSRGRAIYRGTGKCKYGHDLEWTAAGDRRSCRRCAQLAGVVKRWRR